MISAQHSVKLEAGKKGEAQLSLKSKRYKVTAMVIARGSSYKNSMSNNYVVVIAGAHIRVS
jgi:hypothetical protein